MLNGHVAEMLLNSLKYTRFSPSAGVLFFPYKPVECLFPHFNPRSFFHCRPFSSSLSLHDSFTFSPSRLIDAFSRTRRVRGDDSAGRLQRYIEQMPHDSDDRAFPMRIVIISLHCTRDARHAAKDYFIRHFRSAALVCDRYSLNGIGHWCFSTL